MGGIARASFGDRADPSKHRRDLRLALGSSLLKPPSVGVGVGEDGRLLAGSVVVRYPRRGSARGVPGWTSIASRRTTREDGTWWREV
jgi:hypothetical protein